MIEKSDKFGGTSAQDLTITAANVLDSARHLDVIGLSFDEFLKSTYNSYDAIVLDELRHACLYRETSQVFAVLLPVRSVGVMGDGRTYADAVGLRAVTTDDFMTADWARLPYDLLARVSNRIVNEVDGVNRVVYDISSKPPSTIEWE